MVCYSLVMSQASILLLSGSKRGEQGRNQDPLHCAGLTPLQELALNTQGSISKLSLHKHVASRAHPPISTAFDTDMRRVSEKLVKHSCLSIKRDLFNKKEN